ncbi:cell wall protein [Streptomyces sp. NPDC003395]
MRWLIAAGCHSRANATTQTIADDLAARMDYTTGHVRYCLKDMVDRLGIPRATIARHVAYLRELGALAWVQHGTRANIRRALGLGGYAATATVYAAVIPPVYDHAMGHRIIGTGYSARIVIDQRGQARIPAQQQSEPVDNPPVENPGSEARETPSLTWLRKEGKVQVEGGSNYTEQARPTKTRIPHQSSSINGRRRTAADVEKAMRTVRLVRALVSWTQSVPLRRLEFVLRPWTDRGWDALRIADELTGMCSGMRWRPKNPVAFIRARIAQETAHEQAMAQAVDPMQNAEWRALVEQQQALAALLATQQQRTDEDRLRARMDWSIWPQVLDHMAEDPDDALDLYGKRLIDFAINQQARLNHQGVWG